MDAVVEPNHPAAHSPLQPALVSPDWLPKVPAGQSEQLPAPARLYVPAGHSVSVGVTEPTSHA